MRIAAAIISVFLLSMPASAQEVQIRSGDHPGFSRLVVDLPARVAWSMKGAGSQRTLTIEQPGLAFDTTAVFGRIAKDRLTAVTQVSGQSALNMTLGCECEVTAFWYGTSMLVIDVTDPAETAAVEDDVATLESTPRQARPPASIGRTPLVSLTPDTQPSASALAAAGLSAQLTQAASPQYAASGNDDPDMSEAYPSLDDARATLTRQIARAASQGLLTVRTDQNAYPDHQDTEDPLTDRQMDQTDGPEMTAPVAGNVVAAPAPALPEQINLKAETSVDQSAPERPSRQPETSGGRACLPRSVYETQAWATGSAFSLQIGPVRARWTQEFDRFDRSATMDLAHLYLFFGFGAEARQVLATAGFSGRDTEVALAMADVLEDGYASPGSPLSDQLECDSPASLWSALSYQNLPEDVPINANAMLRALGALPPHLRDYLGPQLARKLLGSGRQATAERVLRLLGRDTREPNATEGLARAELNLEASELEVADAKLEDVVNSNSESSAEALVRRIDTRLRTGRGIPDEMADLAGSYALEHRGKPIGRELVRAYIEATAAAGNFEGAFAELTRLDPDLTPRVRDSIRTTVFGLMENNADDITFLRYSMTPPAGFAAGLDGQIGNAIARRLLSLGFPKAAQIYTDAQTDGADQRERRLIRADIALAQNLPRQAEVDVLGMEGSDVNLLRARARSMTGQHGAARLLYVSAGQSEDALREGILAEEWDVVLASDDKEMARMAALVVSEPADPDTFGGPLAQNRALLEESAAVRDVIGQLLNSRAAPE